MILYDHIRSTGGQAIIHHLKQKFPNHYEISRSQPSRSIREFAAMDEPTRHSFESVFGPNAASLRSFVNPKMASVTVLRHPVDRVLSYYRANRFDKSEKWHVVCKSRSVVWCCKNMGHFSNHYAKTFDASKYRFVFLSPESMLRTCGIEGDIESIGMTQPMDFSEEEIEQVSLANRADLDIWNWISSSAKMGMVQVRQPAVS